MRSSKSFVLLTGITVVGLIAIGSFAQGQGQGGPERYFCGERTLRGLPGYCPGGRVRGWEVIIGDVGRLEVGRPQRDRREHDGQPSAGHRRS